MSLLSRNTFKKQERLSSRKQIDEVFAKGAGFSVYPLKVMYLSGEHVQEVPVQSMFVVPKRYFRRAHDRNRIRRRMKEVFRTNKHALYEAVATSGKKLSVAFIYTTAREESFEKISGSLQSALVKLAQKC